MNWNNFTLCCNLNKFKKRWETKPICQETNPLQRPKQHKVQFHFCQKNILMVLNCWEGNILWTDEILVNFLGKMCISVNLAWTQYFMQNIMHTFRHGGGTVMVWSCFVAWGPGQLVINHLHVVIWSTLTNPALNSFEKHSKHTEQKGLIKV